MVGIAVYEGIGKDPGWGAGEFQRQDQIDRRDFGLTGNQALETGGILGNEITISLEVQAVRG